jgi:hypothetical protein
MTLIRTAFRATAMAVETKLWRFKAFRWCRVFFNCLWRKDLDGRRTGIRASALVATVMVHRGWLK